MNNVGYDCIGSNVASRTQDGFSLDNGILTAFWLEDCLVSQLLEYDIFVEVEAVSWTL